MAVARATGLTPRKAADALDAVAAVIRIGLLDEKRVQFVGLGTFSVQPRRARWVRHPSTDEMMELPATVVVTFKPTPELRDQVKERHAHDPEHG